MRIDIECLRCEEDGLPSYFLPRSRLGPSHHSHAHLPCGGKDERVRGQRHRAPSGSSRLRLRVHHGSSTPPRSSTSVPVGSHAAEKRLFRNARRKRAVGSLIGKKLNDSSKRLNLF